MTENQNAYSAFIPEIWSQKLNTMLEKNLQLGDSGDDVRILQEKLKNNYRQIPSWK